MKAPYTLKEDCIHASHNFAHNFRVFLEPRLRATDLGHLPLFPDGKREVQKVEVLFSRLGER